MGGKIPQAPAFVGRYRAFRNEFTSPVQIVDTAFRKLRHSFTPTIGRL
jgi:hypothetical protein